MAIQNISDFHREKVTVTAFAKIIEFRRFWLWIRGKSDVRSDVQSKTLIESIIKIWVYKIYFYSTQTRGAGVIRRERVTDSDTRDVTLFIRTEGDDRQEGEREVANKDARSLRRFFKNTNSKVSIDNHYTFNDVWQTVERRPIQIVSEYPNEYNRQGMYYPHTIQKYKYD